MPSPNRVPWLRAHVVRSSSHPPNSVPLTPPSASSLGADALRDTGLFVTRYEFGLPVRNRKVQI
jgi:hypothetical protein